MNIGLPVILPFCNNIRTRQRLDADPFWNILQITTGKDDKGLKIYDPGYLNTAPVRSSICYIDGDEGILRYRGYPIEELAESSSFVEVAYLLSKFIGLVFFPVYCLCNPATLQLFGWLMCCIPSVWESTYSEPTGELGIRNFTALCCSPRTSGMVSYHSF